MGRLTFLAPIAGLIAGALGTLCVLLMYMLRLRRRPVQVSSTLLWKKSVKDLEGNIPWQRLSPSVLLLLHLLIVALLALAIARPVTDTDLADGQRVAIVIDTTASMGATVNSQSMLQRAKLEASGRVRSLFDSGRSPRVTLIEAGNEPRVVVRDATERGLVLRAIDSLMQSDQPGSPGDAIELLDQISPVINETEERSTPKTLVWMFSDAGSLMTSTLPMRSGYGEVIDLAPELAQSNVGITAISAQRDRIDTGLCRVFLRLVRSEGGPKAAIVHAYEGEQRIASAPISFADGEDAATHTFELRLERAAMIRVEIDADDSLPSDQQAWASIPSPDPLRVTVVAPDAQADPLLLDYLEVISRSAPLVVAPGQSQGDPDLIVYDRVAADQFPAVPSLGFNAPTAGNGSPIESNNIHKVLSWDRNDPMLRGVGLGSISYIRSLRYDEQTPGMRIIAQDQQGPLLVEFIAHGVRHIRAAFALHDSDWAVQVGFTIFIAQLYEQLLPGAGGAGEVYSTTDLIEYQDELGNEQIAGPFPTVGVQMMPDGRQIGVSLLSADESMLKANTGITIGTAASETGTRLSGRVRIDLWRWFIGAAIVLLMIEWIWYTLKVRISA